jgi:hypothetical protein
LEETLSFADFSPVSRGEAPKAGFPRSKALNRAEDSAFFPPAAASYMSRCVVNCAARLFRWGIV